MLALDSSFLRCLSAPACTCAWASMHGAMLDPMLVLAESRQKASDHRCSKTHVGF